MQKLINILAILIYFQTVFSFTTSELNTTCNLETVSVWDQSDELNTSSHGCCTMTSNEKQGAERQCIDRQGADNHSTKKDCNDMCDCPCCYKAAPCYATIYKQIKSKYTNNYIIVFVVSSFHTFDYKRESFQPPRNA